MNMFAYCNGNPVMLVDPSGHSSNSFFTNPVQKFAIFQPNYFVNLNTSSSNSSVSNVGNTIQSPQLSFLDKKGEPNSKVKSPNGNQEREYGPDGKAVKDTDNTNHGNSKKHPKVPHDHDWEWEGDTAIRGPAYIQTDWVTPVLGIGLVAVTAIGMFIIVADDATGLLAVDDVALVPLGAGLGKGMIMIFGG